MGEYEVDQTSMLTGVQERGKIDDNYSVINVIVDEGIIFIKVKSIMTLETKHIRERDVSRESGES